MSEIEKAMLFAIEKHKGQVRKYTGEPYVMHCFEVASKVADMGGSQDMIVAAVLHDTVEDTNTALSEIKKSFGVGVSELVFWLTDVSKPEDGNRETRKQLDRWHLHASPKEAQIIKIADLISNTSSIKKYDPKFYKTYRREKELLVHAMDKLDRKMQLMALEII